MAHQRLLAKASLSARPPSTCVASQGPSTEAGTSPVVNTVGNGGAVLLQTAKATVCSLADPTRTTTVKVVMDGGSQRSVVAYDVKQQLGLPTLQDEWICLKPFGSHEGSAASCVQIIRLHVQSTDGGVIDLDCGMSNAMCHPSTTSIRI